MATVLRETAEFTICLLRSGVTVQRRTKDGHGEGRLIPIEDPKCGEWISTFKEPPERCPDDEINLCCHRLFSYPTTAPR